MKKKNFRYIIVAIVFIIALAIFSDWENFKAGLVGNPPIEAVE
ncbi:hypothetical protein [Sinomicrobium kalidii]|nr:hypothetical protein [Sinomicrobium kalidii]